MASSSACSSIHVAQINFSRPIARSMAQIARSGFSRTPASQPPGSFSRFSSPSPDSCPKPDSQIYIQQLQLLVSNSFPLSPVSLSPSSSRCEQGRRRRPSGARRAAAEALLLRLRLLHLCLLLVLPPEAVLPRRWRRGGGEATAPPAGGTTTRVGPGSPLPLRGPELAASTHQVCPSHLFSASCVKSAPKPELQPYLCQGRPWRICHLVGC